VNQTVLLAIPSGSRPRQLGWPDPPGPLALRPHLAVGVPFLAGVARWQRELRPARPDLERQEGTFLPSIARTESRRPGAAQPIPPCGRRSPTSDAHQEPAGPALAGVW